MKNSSSVCSRSTDRVRRELLWGLGVALVVLCLAGQRSVSASPSSSGTDYDVLNYTSHTYVEEDLDTCQFSIVETVTVQFAGQAANFEWSQTTPDVTDAELKSDTLNVESTYCNPDDNGEVFRCEWTFSPVQGNHTLEISYRVSVDPGDANSEAPIQADGGDNQMSYYPIPKYWNEIKDAEVYVHIAKKFEEDEVTIETGKYTIEIDGEETVLIFTPGFIAPQAGYELNIAFPLMQNCGLLPPIIYTLVIIVVCLVVAALIGCVVYSCCCQSEEDEDEFGARSGERMATLADDDDDTPMGGDDLVYHSQNGANGKQSYIDDNPPSYGSAVVLTSANAHDMGQKAYMTGGDDGGMMTSEIVLEPANGMSMYESATVDYEPAGPSMMVTYEPANSVMMEPVNATSVNLQPQSIQLEPMDMTGYELEVTELEPMTFDDY